MGPEQETDPEKDRCCANCAHWRCGGWSWFGLCAKAFQRAEDEHPEGLAAWVAEGFNDAPDELITADDMGDDCGDWEAWDD